MKWVLLQLQIFQTVFLTLKLTDLIDVSWLWVWAPTIAVGVNWAVIYMLWGRHHPRVKLQFADTSRTKRPRRSKPFETLE